MVAERQTVLEFMVELLQSLRLSPGSWYGDRCGYQPGPVIGLNGPKHGPRGEGILFLKKSGCFFWKRPQTWPPRGRNLVLNRWGEHVGAGTYLEAVARFRIACASLDAEFTRPHVEGASKDAKGTGAVFKK